MNKKDKNYFYNDYNAGQIIGIVMMGLSVPLIILLHIVILTNSFEDWGDFLFIVSVFFLFNGLVILTLSSIYESYK
jgi:hypothetical protein